MTYFWKTKAFSELNKKWAKKLLKSEFIDAEIEINGERILKDSSSSVFRTAGMNHPIYIESRYDFFRAISSALVNEKMMPKIDRIIMEMYCDGFKQRDIINRLKKEKIGCEKGRYGCNRITITRTKARWLHIWNVPLLKPLKTR